MPGIMDLISQLGQGASGMPQGGMPQRPQGVGASMPPQGGMDPGMGMPPQGGGGILEMLMQFLQKAPQGMPGSQYLNMGPAELIQSLIGGGSSLPPLDMLGSGGDEMTRSMMPPQASTMRPGLAEAVAVGAPGNQSPAREKAVRSAENPNMKKKKKKAYKPTPNPRDKMADDMVAADRVGAGGFVRK